MRDEGVHQYIEPEERGGRARGRERAGMALGSRGEGLVVVWYWCEGGKSGGAKMCLLVGAMTYVPAIVCG